MDEHTRPSLAELAAVAARHLARQQALRRRGWDPIQPVTRSDIVDLRLAHIQARREACDVQLWELELHQGGG
jgi:hypothetical protein